MRTKKRHHSSHRHHQQQPQNFGSQTVLAHAISTDGNGIAKGDDGIFIFVKYLLPQEKAQVKILEQKATYKKAVIAKLETESADRTTPKCPYYFECGGCQIQHIQWEKQTQYKINWFFETLKRVGKWDVENIFSAEKKLSVVYLKDHHYRRRIRLHFNGKSLGFRQKSSHQIIDIEHCLTASENLNKKIPFIRKKLHSIFASFVGKVRECEIEITQGDDGRVLYHMASSSCDSRQVEIDFLKAVEKEFEIQKDQLVILKHPQLGKFKVKKQSFVQPHLNCADSYYDKMKSCLQKYLKQYQSNHKKISDPLSFWDLYAGSGIFTGLGHFVGTDLGLNVHCIGVEGVPEAIESLKNNYKDFLKLDSAVKPQNDRMIEAKLQDVSEFLDDQFSQLSSRCLTAGSRPDIVILDPPRSGAGIENMQKLVEICKKHALIMYLACDAASFARDTQILLEGGFHLTDVTLFDAFAQTTHYEVLGCFQR